VIALSVIVPTKDRAAFVARVLESLAAQRGAPDFEAIVVDNGSSDDTPAVVASAAARAPFPIRCISLPVANRALARNAGIEAATGMVLVFVDDDVWLPEGFLQAHAAAHGAGRDRAVSGPIINVSSYDERPRPAPYNFSNAFFVTCNVSVPKAALERVGRFDETFDLYGWEDTEVGLRLREAGVERRFAWNAYLYHINLPEIDTLEIAIGKTVEKATMAARFVRKKPTMRTRLATGAYPLNLLRARIVAPFLPIYAGVASSRRLPQALVTFARARLLDGLYVERLARELRGNDARPPRSA
jgi:glycosyltransferase involved in cell wall biosynthesis